MLLAISITREQRDILKILAEINSIRDSFGALPTELLWISPQSGLEPLTSRLIVDVTLIYATA